ncbi:hypothetical protein SO802_009299 [Lithocarpus litseifolius]|uniref:Transmembrane protein n=1 Tax=Lithocarpus litseifolius TaxID=425828 RepID=A0AAW2DBJ5_9ROSI
MDRSYHVGGVRDHAGGKDRSSLIAFHQSFVSLITVLAILVGIHFQTQKSSPVETHLAMILTLIMAAVVYSIVLAGINLQPRSSENLNLIRLAYFGSGILTCDLLLGLLMSYLWWFVGNLCTILIVIILHRWLQPIYQFLCQSRDWLQKKFEAVRLAASETFSLTRNTEEQQNGGNWLPV